MCPTSLKPNRMATSSGVARKSRFACLSSAVQPRFPRILSTVLSPRKKVEEVNILCFAHSFFRGGV